MADESNKFLEFKFERVSSENGKWQELLKQWEAQAAEYEENLEDFMPASVDVLRTLAEEAQVVNSGVYAAEYKGNYLAICQLNSAFIPGYTGKVLRVRHVTVAPKFDFETDLDIDEYIMVLSYIFVGAHKISAAEMEAPHIKFHFRSPAERVYFKALRDLLHEDDTYASMEMRGSWLYVTKA